MITIFCLSIGILCFSMVYYYVNRAIANPYSELPHYHQMAVLELTSDKHGSVRFIDTPIITQIAQEPLPGINLLALSTINYKRDIKVIDENGKESMYQSQIIFANSGYFAFRGLNSIYTHRPPALNKGEVILTESYARKVFGKKNPIGNKLTYLRAPEDKSEVEYYTIKDVISSPRIKQMQEDDINLFFSHQDILSSSLWNTYVLIDKNQSEKQINKALENCSIFSNDDIFHLEVKPMVRRDETEQAIFILLTLFIASLILVAGLTNFLKFSIQSFYNRMRELGLRKCSGSSSLGLFQLLFYEILLTLLLSSLLALALSELFIPYLYDYLPLSYRKYVHIEIQQLFTLQSEIFILVILICSVFAAIAVAHIRNISIRQSIVGIGKRGKHSFRNFMMGLQLVICFFFTGITLGILQVANDIHSSTYTPLSSDDHKERLQLELSSVLLLSHSREIHEQLKSLPNVVTTVIMGHQHINYKTLNDVTLYGKMIGADANFFSFFKIPLLKGKVPEENKENTIYISEGFDRILQKDSIQGTVTLHSTTYQIAGVYKAAPNDKLDPKYNNISVYIPTSIGDKICIQVAPNTQKEVKKKIEEVCRRYVPETIPLHITTLYQAQDTVIGMMDLTCDIALFLSVVSLLITILSIYSAISLDTERRQKEIAIRKINGATPHTIAFLFSRLYMFLLIAGFCIAFPFIYYILTPIKHDLSNSSLNFFLLGICLFVSISIIVFLTIGYKIDRIMKLNPAIIIKNE